LSHFGSAMDRTRESTNILKRSLALQKKLEHFVQATPENVEAFVFFRLRDTRAGPHRHHGLNLVASTFKEPLNHVDAIYDFLGDGNLEPGVDYQQINLLLPREDPRNACTRPAQPYTFPHPNFMALDEERDPPPPDPSPCFDFEELPPPPPSVEELTKTLFELRGVLRRVSDRVASPDTPPPCFY